MADIIKLQDRRSQIAQPQLGMVAAQILLFTGVRYERLEPPSRRLGSGGKRPKAKSSKQG